jgi:ribonuclease BN (tRNA processing enzyme)
MRLTVLGGSAAGPNPGAGCSGYLLTDGYSAIVIDLGPGTLLELRRHIDLRSLDGLVISHQHLDHILDVAALRYALMYSPSRPVARLPVWIPPGADETLYYLARAFSSEQEAPDFYSEVLDIRTFDPARPLEIATFSIAFAQGVHYIPSWSMRVSSSKSAMAMGYTADTGPASRLEQHLAGVQVLVAEAALSEPGLEPIETRGHLTAEEAGQLASKCKAQTLVLSHLWEEIGFEQQRDRAARAFEGKIEVARPGLMFNIS